MEHIGKIIKPIIEDMGIDKPIKRYQALSLWSKIVGEKINAVSEPIRIEDGKLFIRVKSDTWRNEIFFLKKKILHKLNKEIGKDIVQDIILI